MFVTFLFWLLDRDRRVKRLAQSVYDVVSVAFAGLATAIWSLPPQGSDALGLAVWIALYAMLVVTTSYLLGLYRALIRYVGVRTLAVIIASAMGAAMALWALGQILSAPLSFAAHVVLATLTASFMAMGRLITRELFFLARKIEKPNVVIYGAGDAGRQLLTSLTQSASYRVVAMLDDSPQMRGGEVHGVRVYTPQALPRLRERYALQAVILAMPTLSREQKNKVMQEIESVGLPIKTMPRITDLLSGARSVADIQEVSIEEVLGRDPVPPVAHLLSGTVSGRSVMVTGGGGSIGKELCLQIAALGPAKLVIVESSELALYTVMTALEDQKHLKGLTTVPVLGSVTQEESIKALCQAHAIETVFHAAAYKHVPLVEANPFEGLFNNIFGTVSVLNAASVTGVRNVVLISTDKAVRPTNIMGASKRVAELVGQAYAERFQPLKVSMVRFGNVLSSSGSVIPRFREQIQNGGPVTVTHPEITRFFMTISEAVELVLQASSMAEGDDVFLLEMGEPVKVLDLAKRMIRLSGYREGPAGSGFMGDGQTIEIVYTGLRPGEKLYEELLISGNAQATEHPKIFKAKERSVSWDILFAALDALRKAIAERDIAAVRRVLTLLGVGYLQGGTESHVHPFLSIAQQEPSAKGLPTQISDGAVVASELRSTSGNNPADLSLQSVNTINPLLSKLLHGYFLLRRPMTLGVRAIVVNDRDEIMLVRHRYEPGWQLPGGGVESGESAIEALDRELLEEAGVKMRAVGRFLGSFFNAGVSSRDHVLVYLVTDFDLFSKHPAAYEIDQARFFPRSQLPADTTAGTRRRIQECFDFRSVDSVW